MSNENKKINISAALMKEETK
ncbi:hypothetical protein DESC_790021 [Desulfosarcina cetonica]|nr:hypothetical protein DESC_790021 [Desulfosarcina cetonica]